MSITFVLIRVNSEEENPIFGIPIPAGIIKIDRQTVFSNK